MTAVNYKVGSAASYEHVSNAMQAAGNAMQMTNQRLDANKIKDLSKNMQKQNMKLEMNSDMMDDALDFMDDIENDEEANDIYNQVMAEAGYNTQKEMPNANKSNINKNYNYNKVNNAPYVNPFGNNPYQ